VAAEYFAGIAGSPAIGVHADRRDNPRDDGEA